MPDFSSHSYDGEKREYTHPSKQRTLAKFDADNERRDRLEALREERARKREIGESC